MLVVVVVDIGAASGCDSLLSASKNSPLHFESSLASVPMSSSCRLFSSCKCSTFESRNKRSFSFSSSFSRSSLISHSREALLDSRARFSFNMLKRASSKRLDDKADRRFESNVIVSWTSPLSLEPVVAFDTVVEGEEEGTETGFVTVVTRRAAVRIGPSELSMLTSTRVN